MQEVQGYDDPFLQWSRSDICVYLSHAVSAHVYGVVLVKFAFGRSIFQFLMGDVFKFSNLLPARVLDIPSCPFSLSLSLSVSHHINTVCVSGNWRPGNVSAPSLQSLFKLHSMCIMRYPLEMSA